MPNIQVSVIPGNWWDFCTFERCDCNAEQCGTFPKTGIGKGRGHPSFRVSCSIRDANAEL